MHLEPDGGGRPGIRRQWVAPHSNHLAVEDQPPVIADRQDVGCAGLERPGQAVRLLGDFGWYVLPHEFPVDLVADQGRPAIRYPQAGRVRIGSRKRYRIDRERGGGRGELIVGPAHAEQAPVTHEHPQSQHKTMAGQIIVTALGRRVRRQDDAGGRSRMGHSWHFTMMPASGWRVAVAGRCGAGRASAPASSSVPGDVAPRRVRHRGSMSRWPEGGPSPGGAACPG